MAIVRRSEASDTQGERHIDRCDSGARKRPQIDSCNFRMVGLQEPINNPRSAMRTSRRLDGRRTSSHFQQPRSVSATAANSKR
jgi:hypothetical protein